MTREEELDWLCRLRSEIYVYMPKEWLIPMNNALDMAISALKGEWIPVSERLPEEGRSVLVCFRSQGGMAQAVSERFNISGEWRWSALGGRKPLAWQPLPEPYKKGE